MEIEDLINSDEIDFFQDIQNLQSELAYKYGASAMRMDDEFGNNSVMILPGDGAMQVLRPGVKKD